MAEDEVLEEFKTEYQDAASYVTSGHVTSIFNIYILRFDKI